MIRSTSILPIYFILFLIIGCGGSARAVIAGLQSINLKKITVVARKEDALKNWATKSGEDAQKALIHRAKMNHLASIGEMT